MALPATGVINIMSTATAGNLNGGGFNAARGGTDYSLQNTAQLTATDLTCTAGSTTVTSATGGFTTAMVGNYIHLTALTGTGAIIGWYEIVSRTDTNNVVLDRTPTNGANNITAGTFYVGGALSFGNTLDDDLFEIAVPGNIYYIKGGATYTPGEAISISTAGAALTIEIRGYTTSHADWTTTTGANRPTLDMAANGFTLGNNWSMSGVILKGTAAAVLTGGTGSRVINCKVTNTSTTAGRSAMTCATDQFTFNSEFVSYRGNGIVMNGAAVSCYAHDSNNGILVANGTVVQNIQNCIFESNVTAAINNTTGVTGRVVISGCTLFGSTNKTGIGVNLATASTDVALVNNIITGFVSGAVHADTQTIGFDNYNNYHNNTTDVTNWTKGANDSAVAPSFTSVGQVTGATATTSGSVLTQAGADFTASGVVAGRDYLYLVSGTGVTAGIYGITNVGTTTLTLDIAPGTNATADKVFQITTGRNFAVGPAMKALGFPGAFPGGVTTGYLDQGAIQRQEAAAVGGGSFAFIS